MERSEQLELLKKLTLGLVVGSANPDRYTDFEESFDLQIEFAKECEAKKK